MECYIVGAGEFFGFEELPSPEDYVIAADGGYAVCRAKGVVPNCILGDFDSLGWVPEEENVIRVPVEKDDTDMMLAVKKGLEQGCAVFHIYGGTGGRLDHTVANLQALLYLADRGVRGWLHDGSGKFTALRNDTLVLPARKEGIFSVFAMDGDAKGVCIRGGQYPLEDGTLHESIALAVSNHFVGREVTISVRDGALLVGVMDEN